MSEASNVPRSITNNGSTEGTVGESDAVKAAQQLQPHAAFNNEQGTETLGVSREDDKPVKPVDERATSKDALGGSQPDHEHEDDLKTEAAKVDAFSGQSDDIPAAHNEIPDESPNALPRNVIRD